MIFIDKQFKKKMSAILEIDLEERSLDEVLETLEELSRLPYLSETQKEQRELLSSITKKIKENKPKEEINLDISKLEDLILFDTYWD